MSPQGDISFKWSKEEEKISIATDVQSNGSEYRQAAGYIGSGYTKIAIYVLVSFQRLFFPSLTLQLQARFGNQDYAIVTMKDGHESVSSTLESEFELLLLGDFFHGKFVEFAEEAKVKLPGK
jgi:hypothetical protein